MSLGYLIPASVLLAVTWASAPVFAQTEYGPAYAYGPQPGYAYGPTYAPRGYAYGTRHRAASPAYHGNINGCAVDLGYGRWESCSSIGPR